MKKTLCNSALAAAAFFAACEAAPPVRVTEPKAEILADVRAAVGASTLLRRRDGLTLQGKRTAYDSDGQAISERPTSLAFRPSGTFLFTLGSERGSASHGFDGSRAWSSSARGVTRMLELGSRERLLSDGWLRTMHWLDDGAQPFDIEDDLEHATEELRSLRLTRVGALLEVRVEVDRATGMPRAFETHGRGAVRRVEWDDWSNEDGISLPTIAAEYVDGRLVHRDVYTERIAGTPRSFGAPRSQPNDARYHLSIDPIVPTRIDQGGHVYAQTTILGADGREALGWMLVDTGFTRHALSAEIAQQAGVPGAGDVALSGATQRASVGWVSIASLRVGQLEHESPSLILIDTKFLSDHAGFPVAGVLGVPLFERAVVVLDDRRGRVEVHEPTSFRGERFVWDPVARDDGSTCVVGSISNSGRTTPSLWFRLDTGSDDSLTVASWVVQRHGLEGERAILRPVKIEGVFGTLSAWRRRVNRVEIGGLTLIRPEVTLLRGVDEGPLADPWVAANVGARALVGRRVVIDLPRSRVSFGGPDR